MNACVMKNRIMTKKFHVLKEQNQLVGGSIESTL